MTVLGYALTTVGFGMSVNPTYVTGTADFDALQTTVGAIFSIALGTLVGSSIFDGVARLKRRRQRLEQPD